MKSTKVEIEYMYSTLIDMAFSYASTKVEIEYMYSTSDC